MDFRSATPANAGRVTRLLQVANSRARLRRDNHDANTPEGGLQRFGWRVQGPDAGQALATRMPALCL